MGWKKEKNLDWGFPGKAMVVVWGTYRHGLSLWLFHFFFILKNIYSLFIYLFLLLLLLILMTRIFFH